MSKDIINLNKFKARREQEIKAAEDTARAEAEQQNREPPHVVFHNILTPTPITPASMRHYMTSLLHSLTERFNEAHSANPNVIGVFNAHLRLTDAIFSGAGVVQACDSYEAALKESASQKHKRIIQKALRDNAHASQAEQTAAIKNAFMSAMIGDTYAYRAVAKQLKETFPALSWNPRLIRISPKDVLPSIEIHVPERKGHDLIALVERYLYKFEDRNQDGSRKPPPHLKPV